MSCWSAVSILSIPRIATLARRQVSATIRSAGRRIKGPFHVESVNAYHRRLRQRVAAFRHLRAALGLDAAGTAVRLDMRERHFGNKQW